MVRNATLAVQLFGDKYSTSYFEAETNVNLLPSSSCVATPGWFTPAGSLCPGAPGNADDCMLADGSTAFRLRVMTSAGASWDPAAYTSAMNSLSTGLQIFIFIALSGVADFGPHRKRMFTALSLLGCVFCWLCLSVGASSWEWGGALIVLTSVCYSSSYVFYNAWLPLLGANDAAVLAAPAEEQDAVFMARMHDISSRGYAWGYFGSVICLIICVGITISFSGDSLTAYGVNCFVAGCWWFLFSLFTFWWLRPRPGPPLPPGENYFTLPWKRMAVTVSRVRQLPQTFGFLLCWFMFADGFNVISSVGAIYANSSVSWQGFPKSIGLAALLVITPIFAGLGNIFWNWVHNRGWMSPKTIMRVNMILMAAVPAYGLLGFADRSLGYRRFWELYIGVIVYGFMLGSLQSFSRSAFGAMIPEGLEAQFYSL
jgi:UMF1 family MFS transporter